MTPRVFEDENGKIWIVDKRGTQLQVIGKRSNKESLQEIAKSCARKLGVTQTRSGVPFQQINEHRRIWSAIWEKGRTTK